MFYNLSMNRFRQHSQINFIFPQDVGGWVNSTLQETAEDFCSNAVINDALVADCIANELNFNERTVEDEITGCVEDIRVRFYKLNCFYHWVPSSMISSYNLLLCNRIENN